MNAEADSTGTVLFMYNSNSRTYFSCAQRNVQALTIDPEDLLPMLFDKC